MIVKIDDDTIRMAPEEQTQEVALHVDSIMREKAEVIDFFCQDIPERMLLLKELMLTVYISGFFAGVRNAAKDPDRPQN